VTDRHPAQVRNAEKGPYRITHVFANGTIQLQIGATNDNVNIRRIEPAFE
jgi:hypothetical protein